MWSTVYVQIASPFRPPSAALTRCADFRDYSCLAAYEHPGWLLDFFNVRTYHEHLKVLELLGVFRWLFSS